MIGRYRRAAVLTLIVLAACGGGAPPEQGAPVETPRPAWIELGGVPLDSNGKTPELRVPWPVDGQGLLLDVSSPNGLCFALDELSDDTGHRFIGPAESGAYCMACEQRVSVAAGAGLFVLPSGGAAFSPIGALRFRLGLRDCTTLTQSPLVPGGQTLSVRARGTLRAPLRGTVALRLVVTPASAFHSAASDTALQAVLDALNAELAPAQLSARLAQLTRLPAGAPSDAGFSVADTSALQRLLQTASPSPAGNTIPVVLAGCLRLAEPVLGRTTEPQGYTPRVPGGAGPADGVFIQGSLCGTPGPVRVEWSASALARVLAHELGHYLGLYHTVEADGSSDALADTDATNLMFYRPGQSGATGLSALQGAVMRAHPAVTPVN